MNQSSAPFANRGETDFEFDFSSVFRHAMAMIGIDAGPPLSLHIGPHVVDADGQLDLGVLGVFIDLACTQFETDRHYLHVDIALTRVAKPVGSTLTVATEMVRVGKRSAIVRLHVHDDTGLVVAESTQQLALGAQPDTDTDPPDYRDNLYRPFDGKARLSQPLADALDVTVDEGRAEMPLDDRHRNGFGGLHGGVAFVLVAAAAQSALPTVDQATLRYLRPALGGPCQAVVTASADGHAIVDVFDLGADNQHVITADVNSLPHR